jgi:hypothetical protein
MTSTSLVSALPPCRKGNRQRGGVVDAEIELPTEAAGLGYLSRFQPPEWLAIRQSFWDLRQIAPDGFARISHLFGNLNERPFLLKQQATVAFEEWLQTRLGSNAPITNYDFVAPHH